MSHLTVIGCGLSPDDLGPSLRAEILAAAILAGGRQWLQHFPDHPGQQVVLGAEVETTLDQLVTASASRTVVVLASGDPLCFGIGATLARRLPPSRLRIRPNVSAGQAACARLGLPWTGLRWLSVHGRTAPLAWEQALAASGAAILTDAQRPPERLATDLIAAWPAAAGRQVVVAERLGRPEERLWPGRLDELAGLAFDGCSVVLILPDGELTATPPLALGEADAAYDHQRGLITHPEVRAVALAHLRLVPGWLWDLGAGSGAVGIEAARLCPGLQVLAVERDPQRLELIQANARRFGVPLEAMAGHLPAALAGLPGDPHRIFLGGGGSEVGTIAQAALDRLRPGGRLVASAVLHDSVASLLQVQPNWRQEAVELAVRRARPLAGATFFEPENPITIISWLRP